MYMWTCIYIACKLADIMISALSVDSDDDLSDHMATQLQLESPLHALRSQWVNAVHMHSQAALLAEGLQDRQVSPTYTAIARQAHPEEHAPARKQIHTEKALQVCEDPVHRIASQADIGAPLVEQPDLGHGTTTTGGFHATLVVEVAVAGILRCHRIEYHVESPVLHADLT